MTPVQLATKIRAGFSTASAWRTSEAALAELLACLSAAEQERDQWEQRTESANRRLDEASNEAMQANLRAAAAEARVEAAERQRDELRDMFGKVPLEQQARIRAALAGRERGQ